MTTEQAITYLLNTLNCSKYELAQRIGCAPVSINQWLRGTKMGPQYRKELNERFGVVVDDCL